MDKPKCEIDRLPESCISHVLSFTSPRDSCRAAVVSLTFRQSADAVWSRFLPPDYREILSRTVDPVNFTSCKELYFKLCDSVLIDGGTKVLSLEKATGAKCFALGAKELHTQQVVPQIDLRWVSHPESRYCTMHSVRKSRKQHLKKNSTRKSRFAEVAEIWYSNLLEIQWYIDCKELSSNTTYKSYLIFKPSDLVISEDQVSVKLGTQISKGKACLQQNRSHLSIFGNSRRELRVRSNGWKEVELGEFYNKDGSGGDVCMSFKRVSRVLGICRCLIIQCVEVRPK